MKKKNLENIFYVFIGMMLVNIINVGAAAIKAKDIPFTAKNENWSANNIEGALNDLYSLKGTIEDINNTGNATETDVLNGKTCLSSGKEVTGNVSDKKEETYTPGTSDQIISNGQCLSGNQTIKGDSNLLAGNIKTGTSIFGVSGTYTSDANATAAQILSGKTGYVNGAKITGTIASKAATTYTPGTSNQTIAASQYLSGVQTIKGDANLVAGNIKTGTSIFGVSGTYTSDANATAAQILSGKTGYVNGSKITGSMRNLDGSWIWYGSGIENYTYSDGRVAPMVYVRLRDDVGNAYISTKSKLIVGQESALKSAMLSGKTLLGVTGTATSDANATAAQILSGKTAYVNGAKITGTIASKAAATYTPTTSNQTIAASQYLSGAQTIKGDSNLVAGNIKKGVSIFGVSGSYAATGSNAGIHNKSGTFCGSDWFLTSNLAAGTYIVTNVMYGTASTGSASTMSVYKSSTSGADSVTALSSIKNSYGIVETYLAVLNSARSSGTAMGRMSNCSHTQSAGSLYGHSIWSKIS